MTGQHDHVNHETCSSQAADLGMVLRRYAADPTASWGLGTFGAIAEFHRAADEPASISTDDATLQVVTARGALRLSVTREVRAFAYELPAAGDSWHQALALCLPAMPTPRPRRPVLTECGPDHEALRPEDRAGVLFNLGLGTDYVDVCVRTADPDGLTGLRTGLDRPLLAADNPLMPALVRLSPHRVFICRFARIEVYQRIPGHGETPPEGPHTHVLPKLLRSQRSHSAAIPIPDGWVPCLSLFPANPVRDAHGHPQPFDSAAHEAFQALLRSFGDPALLELKEAVREAVRADRTPDSFPPPGSRADRATVRVALRQLAHTEGHHAVLSAWQHAFDRREAAA